MFLLYSLHENGSLRKIKDEKCVFLQTPHAAPGMDDSFLQRRRGGPTSTSELLETRSGAGDQSQGGGWSSRPAEVVNRRTGADFSGGRSLWRRESERGRRSRKEEVAEMGERKLERDVLKGIIGMSPWSLSHACFLTVIGFNYL